MSLFAARILVGNALFVVCCVFYLAWWLVSFRPGQPVIAQKMLWLLIPAAAAGLAGVIVIIWAMASTPDDKRVFANVWVLVGGIVAYIVLMIVTKWLFDRPVTSELLLFTGWAALAFAIVNALYGAGLISRPALLVWFVVIALVLVACLACYVLYYRLGDVPKYIDGAVPLLLTALVMVALSIPLLWRGGA